MTYDVFGGSLNSTLLTYNVFSVCVVLLLQELTEKKSLLSECEMKCRNVQSALSHTQSLIKVLHYMIFNF